MKGILDRFEDQDQAVILVEEDKQELVVPKSELPEGSKVNTYFTLEKVGKEYKIIAIDHTETEKAAEKTSDLMAQLRAKKSGSKYKK